MIKPLNSGKVEFAFDNGVKVRVSFSHHDALVYMVTPSSDVPTTISGADALVDYLHMLSTVGVV